MTVLLVGVSVYVWLLSNRKTLGANTHSLHSTLCYSLRYTTPSALAVNVGNYYWNKASLVFRNYHYWCLAYKEGTKYDTTKYRLVAGSQASGSFFGSLYMSQTLTSCD